MWSYTCNIAYQAEATVSSNKIWNILSQNKNFYARKKQSVMEINNVEHLMTILDILQV